MGQVADNSGIRGIDAMAVHGFEQLQQIAAIVVRGAASGLRQLRASDSAKLTYSSFQLQQSQHEIASMAANAFVT